MKFNTTSSLVYEIFHHTWSVARDTSPAHCILRKNPTNFSFILANSSFNGVSHLQNITHWIESWSKNIVHRFYCGPFCMQQLVCQLWQTKRSYSLTQVSWSGVDMLEKKQLIQFLTTHLSFNDSSWLSLFWISSVLFAIYTKLIDLLP